MNIVWTFDTYYLGIEGRPSKRRDKNMRLILHILFCNLMFQFNILKSFRCLVLNAFLRTLLTD